MLHDAQDNGIAFLAPIDQDANAPPRKPLMQLVEIFGQLGQYQVGRLGPVTVLVLCNKLHLDHTFGLGLAQLLGETITDVGVFQQLRVAQ